VTHYVPCRQPSRKLPHSADRTFGQRPNFSFRFAQRAFLIRTFFAKPDSGCRLTATVETSHQRRIGPRLAAFQVQARIVPAMGTLRWRVRDRHASSRCQVCSRTRHTEDSGHQFLPAFFSPRMGARFAKHPCRPMTEREFQERIRNLHEELDAAIREAQRLRFRATRSRSPFCPERRDPERYVDDDDDGPDAA
jgi:hypothetical protein